MMDSAALREVAIQVSGYFRDFLESDFKKKAAPRRRILLQSEQGFRCGMRAQPYSTLNKDLWHFLAQPSSVNEVLKVAPRQYTRPISPNLRLVIQSQIEQIKQDALFRVLEALSTKITETAAEGARDAEEWIDEMLAYCCAQICERVVRPLVQRLDEPLRRSSYDVIDSLYSAENDMVAGVEQPLLTVMPELLAKHLATSDPTSDLSPLKQAMTMELVLERVQKALTDFFDGFVTADAFLELRDVETFASINEGFLRTSA